MSKYTEIIVKTTHIASEIVADIMQCVTDEGVVIYDRNDLAVPTWDYVDEQAINNQYSDDEVIVKGYITNQNIDNILSNLQQQLKNIDKSINVGTLAISVAVCDSQDWSNNWKQYFVPITIGDITICPEWLSSNTTNNDKTKTVLLDSGMAFGTGQHETTRLIIRLMQNISVADINTLDIGCGSGVLGITSIKLGALGTTMLDIDEQATQTALHNANTNNVSDKCKIICCDLSCIKDNFKVVFANLTSEILIANYSNIANSVAKDGYLLLSGILDTRLDAVKKVFLSDKFTLIEQQSEGEWIGLLLKKIVLVKQ